MDKIIRAALLWFALGGTAAAQQLSALPQASTPLVGNELAYIVQGGAAKQVSVSNFVGGTACSIVSGCTYQSEVIFGGSPLSLLANNNVTILGVTTLGPAAGNRMTITGGAASTNAITLGQSGTGGFASAANFNLSGSLTVSGGNPNIVAASRLEVGNGTTTSSLILNGVTTVFRGISMQTAASNRWQELWFGTETGSNVGSDFEINGIADDGATVLYTPLLLTRHLQNVELASFTSMDLSNHPVAYGGLYIAQNYTGATPPSAFIGNTFPYNLINITSDNANMGTTSPRSGIPLQINYNFGGSQMTGGRELQINATMDNPSGNFSLTPPVNAFYNGLHVTMQADSGDGGTGLTTSTAAGQFSAYNPQLILTGGATNVYSAVIEEANISWRTGASGRSKTGIQIVKTSDDVAVGSLGVDTALGFYDQATTAVYWNYGIRFGGTDSGQWSVNPTTGHIIGSTIGAEYGTFTAGAGYGVDFLQATFNNYAFRSNGWSVDPNGVGQYGAGLVSPTSSGMSADTGGAIGTGTPTINAGGSGFPASSARVVLTNEPYGAVYAATTNGSGVVTSINTVIRQPTANTISGLPSTLALSAEGRTDGTGAVVNVSWDTSRTTLGIGNTNAVNIVMGNSGSTITLTGTIKAGASTGLSCTGTPSSSFATVNGIVTHC